MALNFNGTEIGSNISINGNTVQNLKLGNTDVWQSFPSYIPCPPTSVTYEGYVYEITTLYQRSIETNVLIDYEAGDVYVPYLIDSGQYNKSYPKKALIYKFDALTTGKWSLYGVISIGTGTSARWYNVTKMIKLGDEIYCFVRYVESMSYYDQGWYKYNGSYFTSTSTYTLYYKKYTGYYVVDNVANNQVTYHSECRDIQKTSSSVNLISKLASLTCISYNFNLNNINYTIIYGYTTYSSIYVYVIDNTNKTFMESAYSTNLSSLPGISGCMFRTYTNMIFSENKTIATFGNNDAYIINDLSGYCGVSYTNTMSVSDFQRIYSRYPVKGDVFSSNGGGNVQTNWTFSGVNNIKLKNGIMTYSDSIQDAQNRAIVMINKTETKAYLVQIYKTSSGTNKYTDCIFGRELIDGTTNITVSDYDQIYNDVMTYPTNNQIFHAYRDYEGNWSLFKYGSQHETIIPRTRNRHIGINIITGDYYSGAVDEGHFFTSNFNLDKMVWSAINA